MSTSLNVDTSSGKKKNTSPKKKLSTKSMLEGEQKLDTNKLAKHPYVFLFFFEPSIRDSNAHRVQIVEWFGENRGEGEGRDRFDKDDDHA